MPRYLFQASYSVDGVKGLLQEGGSSRRTAIEELVQGLGGSVEAYYYCFGEDDVYVIVDLLDNVTAAAISLRVAGSGAGRVKTVALLTPEEVDEATQKSVAYRPPGA